MSVYNISGPLSLSEILCVWDTSKKGKFGSLKEKENTSLSSPDTPCSTKSYLNMRQSHKIRCWPDSRAGLQQYVTHTNTKATISHWNTRRPPSQSCSWIPYWLQMAHFCFVNHSQLISIIVNLFLSFSIDFNYSQLISTILNWFQLIGGYSWYWADLPRTRRVQFSIGHLLHFGITLWYIWISLSHIWITSVELFHSLCKI